MGTDIHITSMLHSLNKKIKKSQSLARQVNKFCSFYFLVKELLQDVHSTYFDLDLKLVFITLTASSWGWKQIVKQMLPQEKAHWSAKEKKKLLGTLAINYSKGDKRSTQELHRTSNIPQSTGDQPSPRLPKLMTSVTKTKIIKSRVSRLPQIKSIFQ